MDVEDHRARLGDLVRARRKLFRPRLTQAAAAAQAGCSDTTWFKVEKGQPVSEETYADVERVIRWAPRSVQTVLNGGDPTELPLDGDTPDFAQEIAELRARLAAVEARLASEPPEDGPARADRPA